ncbi:uncharacterized protein J4E79_008123 [Alternaria viburni]|uniref:uncharacterized protein n=1 Tax=Alternaria viburni TaxID=566460 RepID=UPI0020C354C4|nr:uncharacterized protein J4E79_008123 [Alternaria viburni]KAI4655058.1 hypothetical protein J4E79_008123 [Alternaria viburni]
MSKPRRTKDKTTSRIESPEIVSAYESVLAKFESINTGDRQLEDAANALLVPAASAARIIQRPDLASIPKDSQRSRELLGLQELVMGLVTPDYSFNMQEMGVFGTKLTGTQALINQWETDLTASKLTKEMPRLLVNASTQSDSKPTGRNTHQLDTQTSGPGQETIVVGHTGARKRRKLVDQGASQGSLGMECSPNDRSEVEPTATADPFLRASHIFSFQSLDTVGELVTPFGFASPPQPESTPGFRRPATPHRPNPWAPVAEISSTLPYEWSTPSRRPIVPRLLPRSDAGALKKAPLVFLSTTPAPVAPSMAPIGAIEALRESTAVPERTVVAPRQSSTAPEVSRTPSSKKPTPKAIPTAFLRTPSPPGKAVIPSGSALLSPTKAAMLTTKLPRLSANLSTPQADPPAPQGDLPTQQARPPTPQADHPTQQADPPTQQADLPTLRAKPSAPQTGTPTEQVKPPTLQVEGCRSSAQYGLNEWSVRDGSPFPKNFIASDPSDNEGGGFEPHENPFSDDGILPREDTPPVPEERESAIQESHSQSEAASVTPAPPRKQPIAAIKRHERRPQASSNTKKTRDREVPVKKAGKKRKRGPVPKEKKITQLDKFLYVAKHAHDTQGELKPLRDGPRELVMSLNTALDTVFNYNTAYFNKACTITDPSNHRTYVESERCVAHHLISHGKSGKTKATSEEKEVHACNSCSSARRPCVKLEWRDTDPYSDAILVFYPRSDDDRPEGATWDGESFWL